jgi:hypothetical protein
MQRRVLAAVSSGGAFTAGVGPFKQVSGDLLTVKLAVKHR